MEPGTVKGKPLTKEETMILLNLIEPNKIITSKTINATNNLMKKREWNVITNRFNERCRSSKRTPQQLRLKWENLKKNVRKQSTTMRMNSNKTDAPYEYTPLNEILEKVASILKHTSSEFDDDFCGERDQDTFESESCNVAIVDASATPGNIGADGFGCVTVDPFEGSSADPFGACAVGSDAEITSTVGSTNTRPRYIGKKKHKRDEGRTARNLAIAEYFITKKKFLEIKIQNMQKTENKIIKPD